MTIISKVQDIRRMRGEGESIAGISRATGVSKLTVRKYLICVKISDTKCRSFSRQPSFPRKSAA